MNNALKNNNEQLKARVGRFMSTADDPRAIISDLYAALVRTEHALDVAERENTEWRKIIMPNGDARIAFLEAYVDHFRKLKREVADLQQTIGYRDCQIGALKKVNAALRTEIERMRKAIKLHKTAIESVDHAYTSKDYNAAATNIEFTRGLLFGFAAPGKEVRG